MPDMMKSHLAPHIGDALSVFNLISLIFYDVFLVSD